jgi:hypothetical protein
VAQLPQPLPAVASQPVQQDHYPAPPFRFANGVRGVPAVVYRTQPGHRPLTLDLYLPPAAARRPAHGFPLVVYIHGGALMVGDWLGGDARRSGVFVDFPAVLAALAARGYVVASVDYRLSGEAIFPAQIQDVKAAIKFLRLHAADYAIDPARAIAWGASAGAHLAALAAVSCGAQPLEPRQTMPPAAPESPAGTAAPADVSDCVQGSRLVRRLRHGHDSGAGAAGRRDVARPGRCARVAAAGLLRRPVQRGPTGRGQPGRLRECALPVQRGRSSRPSRWRRC